ncbi:MAG: hypothetical protein ABFS46_11805, partial [Myxococcota bacterium]
MSLASALEHAAVALPELSDAVRPANGDPAKLLANLDPGGAARVLEWLLVHETPAGAELVGAFLDEPEGASPVLALRAAELPKEARKLVRRALHRLRSEGREVPEPETAPRVARLAPLSDELGGAYASGLDPSGARLVAIVEAHPGGGARVFEIVVDEARGVLDFHVASAGRRQARAFVRELLGRERWSVVEVPRAAAEALLARVAARRDPERPPPREFEEWRSRLAAPAEGELTPGDLVGEALGEATDPLDLERAEALVRERVVGPWPPPVELLQAFAARIREAAEGRVIVSGAAKRERIETALTGCLGDAFDEVRTRATAHALRESAYVLWKSERESEARACLAAARSFDADGPEANPVARALLEQM